MASATLAAVSNVAPSRNAVPRPHPAPYRLIGWGSLPAGNFDASASVKRILKTIVPFANFAAAGFGVRGSFQIFPSA